MRELHRAAQLFIVCTTHFVFTMKYRNPVLAEGDRPERAGSDPGNLSQ
jgi:hypothetical protein